MSAFYGLYPLVNVYIANWKITIFQSGKSTMFSNARHSYHVAYQSHKYFPLYPHYRYIAAHDICLFNTTRGYPHWSNLIQGNFGWGGLVHVQCPDQRSRNVTNIRRHPMDCVPQWWPNEHLFFLCLNWYIQCEAPKIAKLVYNSNNYGLWHL